jgi:hypothetical protein
MKLKCVYNSGKTWEGDGQFKIGEWYELISWDRDGYRVCGIQANKYSLVSNIRFDGSNNRWVLMDDSVDCYFITIEVHRDEQIDKLL